VLEQIGDDTSQQELGDKKPTLVPVADRWFEQEGTDVAEKSE